MEKAVRVVDINAILPDDAPVGRIRATVRAGRDRMRAQLLAWLAPGAGSS